MNRLATAKDRGVTSKPSTRSRTALHDTKWVQRLERRRVAAVPTGIPLHLTTLLGAVSAACVFILVVTGVLLMTFFEASSEQVIYDGSYAPMRGVQMSEAYASVLHVSFDVRAGLLLRQAHHWAALLLPASLLLQLVGIFFQGAFKRPRRGAWVLLCTAFVAALGAGWSGYGLPDDQLSGTGLRIFEGILRGVPLIGSYASLFVFRGEFPGRIIETLYPLHVAVFPVAVVLALGVRAWRLGRLAPLEPAIGSRTRVVPRPVARLATSGLLVITAGWVVLMAGLVAVNPVWRYGPASGSRASAGSQPDWYTGFLDGALRLAPSNWDVTVLGWTLPMGVLVPQLIAGGLLAAIFAWPFLPNTSGGGTTESASHERMRDDPTRSAAGAAGLTVFLTLLAAGASDWTATQLHFAFELQIYALRVVLVLGPIVAFLATRMICRGLVAEERDKRAHGVGPHALVRDAHGGYSDVSVSVTSALTKSDDT